MKYISIKLLLTNVYLCKLCKLRKSGKEYSKIVDGIDSLGRVMNFLLYILLYLSNGGKFSKKQRKGTYMAWDRAFAGTFCESHSLPRRTPWQ